MVFCTNEGRDGILRRIEALARVRETLPDISRLPRELRVAAEVAIANGRRLRERDRREIEVFGKWLRRAE